MARVTWLMLFLLAPMQLAQVAVAAPAYPLDGLLPRAETVFIGRVTKQDDKNISLAVTEHLRGEKKKEFTFERVGDYAKTPLELKSRYFIISQGDNHFGNPKPIITLGQGLRGQAGYCGWIMMPLKTEGEQTYLERVAARSASGRLTIDAGKRLVEQVPYNPAIYGQKMSKVEPPATPPASPLAQLLLKLDEARKIACAQIKDLNPRLLTQGSLAPSYSSRESAMPTGTIVTFTIRGSYRTEKLGELVDKVVVIFPDDPKATVMARKVTVWLNQGLLGVTR